MMAVKYDADKPRPAFLSDVLVLGLDRLKSEPPLLGNPSLRVRKMLYKFLDWKTSHPGTTNEQHDLLIRCVRACDLAFSGDVDHKTGLSREFEEEILRVREFGAKLYSEDNWKLGFLYKRSINAALRHINAFIDGQLNDPQSGFSHLAHCVCCIEHLVWTFIKCGPEFDDRFEFPQYEEAV